MVPLDASMVIIQVKEDLRWPERLRRAGYKASMDDYECVSACNQNRLVAGTSTLAHGNVENADSIINTLLNYLPIPNLDTFMVNVSCILTSRYLACFCTSQIW